MDHKDLSVDDEDVAEVAIEVKLRHGDDLGQHILDLSKLGCPLICIHIHTYMHTCTRLIGLYVSTRRCAKRLIIPNSKTHPKTYSGKLKRQ